MLIVASLYVDCQRFFVYSRKSYFAIIVTTLQLRQIFVVAIIFLSVGTICPILGVIRLSYRCWIRGQWLYKYPQRRDGSRVRGQRRSRTTGWSWLNATCTRTRPDRNKRFAKRLLRARLTHNSLSRFWRQSLLATFAGTAEFSCFTYEEDSPSFWWRRFLSSLA